MSDTYFFSLLFSFSVLGGMWVCERGSRYPERARVAYLVGVFGGIAGARLWYVFQYGDWLVRGPLSAWGFVIGATAASLTYLHRSYAWRCDFGDAVAPAVAAGGALTRLGCFWIGCNFGKPTGLPWGVRYAPDTLAYRRQIADGLLDPGSPWTKPVHPTQLYEAGALFLAFLVLLWLARRPRRRRLSGELALGLGLYYALVRFLNEFLRADSGGAHAGALTFAQATCLGAAAVAALTILLRHWNHRLRARSNPPPAAGVAENLPI